MHNQKFGSSISAGSFIAFLKATLLVQEKMNQCDVSDTFLTPCFLLVVTSLFHLFQSSSTSPFCHANIHESGRLFYVCVV